jgi:hypothetical protein
MDLNLICEKLLCQLKTSGLNYSLTESPFSVNITLRKSFVKNKSGTTNFPQASSPVPPQNIDLQSPVTTSDPNLKYTSQTTCCKSQAKKRQDMTTSTVTSQGMVTTFSSNKQAMRKGSTLNYPNPQAVNAPYPIKQAMDTSNLLNKNTSKKKYLIMEARHDLSLATSSPSSQAKVSAFPTKQTPWAWTPSLSTNRPRTALPSPGVSWRPSIPICRASP